MEKELLDDARHRMDKAVEAVRHGVQRRCAAGAPAWACSIASTSTTTAPRRRSSSWPTWPRRSRAFSPCSRTTRRDARHREGDHGVGPRPQPRATTATIIRLPVPALTEERRRDLVKLVHRLAEDGKVAVRNVRRDCMKDLKELVHDGEVGEDAEKRAEEAAAEAHRRAHAPRRRARQEEGSRDPRGVRHGAGARSAPRCAPRLRVHRSLRQHA